MTLKTCRILSTYPTFISFYSILFLIFPKMRYSFVVTTLTATAVSGHGVIRTIEGANGVSMPGLTGKNSLASPGRMF